MDYEIINKIFVTKSDKDCNLFLSYGWFLLNIEQPTNFESSNASTYVLGFPGKRDAFHEVEPTYPPKKTKIIYYGGEDVEREIEWD